MTKVLQEVNIAQCSRLKFVSKLHLTASGEAAMVGDEILKHERENPPAINIRMYDIVCSSFCLSGRPSLAGPQTSQVGL